MQPFSRLYRPVLPKFRIVSLRSQYGPQVPASLVAFLHPSSTPQSDHEDHDLAAARQWFSKFGPGSIPKSICDVSFSRASGPGGQNVNKVNSKATLRVPLSLLLPLLPSVLHSEIKASHYYKDGSDTLVIQADESRKQKSNTQECFAKLDRLILSAARKTIPGETSSKQRQHVKDLQKSANEQRLKAKKLISSKKSARKLSGNE